MFDPTSWSRLGGLLFTAKTLVDGLYAGGHASPRHGAGMEFHDYRPYVPGDDLSAVDWKLFGRTDRYYLRRDRRYSDLHVQLLVDVSASMDFAALDGPTPDRPTKLAVAKQLAAAIAFLTIRQGDRVGLALGGQRLREAMPVRNSWPHLQQLCATLEQATVNTGAGDVGACLRQLHAMRQRRGLVVLLSDLLDEPGPMLDGLQRLRHDRFEVIVLQVLSPNELHLSQAGVGWRRLVDAESSRRADVRLSGAGAKAEVEYDRRMASHLAALRTACLSRGAAYQLVRTDQPALMSLRQYLARRSAAGW
ncbi:DUF58 domain-containing protein [Phycisphaerales bacterium AB-hyl4]|uniref:DUF58 domain-containing protein n=1 Tax=Natronomicrosphaera hydrolytica TaxID=3242702 RepID=A0ABV4U8L2_9BACT